MKPVVLKTFTSSINSDKPKQVFRMGEDIQWNAVHIRIPFLGNPNIRKYETEFYIERHHHTAAYGEEEPFELIFKLEKRVIVTGNYGPVPIRKDWIALDQIPIIDEDLQLHVDNHEERIQLIEDFAMIDERSIFLPAGYWKFRAFVQLVDPHEKPFSVSKEWHFKILRYDE